MHAIPHSEFEVGNTSSRPLRCPPGEFDSQHRTQCFPVLEAPSSIDSAQRESLRVEEPLDGRAVELYERIVGSTVEIVCRQMIDEFNLASALGSSDLADGADSEHWKELHRLRMDEYRENHGALGRLQANAYQHNVDLLVPSEIDREGRFRGYIIVY